MPQERVEFSSRVGYPGLVVRGDVIRGYDSRFYNDSNWVINYGMLVAYTGRRTDGGLVGASAESWNAWTIARADCGVAAVTAPYLYDKMYREQVNGYLPRAEVEILQQGDIWLRVWMKVKAGQPVTFKRRPFRYSFLGEADTVGQFSGIFDRPQLIHQKVGENSYWLTNANAGELAIARLDFIERVDGYLPGEGVDPF